MVETPSNPLNTLVDLSLIRAVADEIGARQGGEAPVGPEGSYFFFVR